MVAEGLAEFITILIRKEDMSIWERIFHIYSNKSKFHVKYTMERGRKFLQVFIYAYVIIFFLKKD